MSNFSQHQVQLYPNLGSPRAANNADRKLVMVHGLHSNSSQNICLSRAVFLPHLH